LCDKLIIDWRPDKKIINEIINKPLKDWPRFDSQEEKNDFFLKIIDPRTDFLG